jgi:hypothetical protein
LLTELEKRPSHDSAAADTVLSTFTSFWATDFDLSSPFAGVPQLPATVIANLTDDSMVHLKLLSPVLDVSSGAVIVGDLHGSICDLLRKRKNVRLVSE